jgi:hypothetical protein
VDYDYVTGSINYDDGVSHKRQIWYIKKQFWLIKDTVSVGKKNIEVESYLHFHPDVNLLIDTEQQTIIASVDGVGILIKYFTKAAKILSTKGGGEPSEGWVASGYGMSQEAWRVQITWNVYENKGVFPLFIIPWQTSYDSIHCGLSETAEEINNIFNVNLSIESDNYIISINKNKADKIFNRDLNKYVC